MLIDTHFHLDLSENMQGLIQQLRSSQIGIIAVGTTPKAFMRTQKYVASLNNIEVGLGLHPQLIMERGHEIDLFLDLVKESKYIGEVGLDFNAPNKDFKEQQIACFREIAEKCTVESNKVLSIHSVKAAEEVINELNRAGTFKTCICIFHWFSGSAKDRKKAVEMGAYFSINPRMLKTKSGRETIISIPKDKILLETDAPFTKKYNNVDDLEIDLLNLVQGISDIRGEEMMSQINLNNNRIWG